RMGEALRSRRPRQATQYHHHRSEGSAHMTEPRRRWYPLGDEAGSRARARGVARPAKIAGPIDPLTGPKLALAGRVVTMDDTFTVKDNAVLYVDRGSI